MLQDLHSHTFYSFCGGDEPDAVVDAAIAAQGDHPDDITAVALRLCLPPEED